MRQSDARDTEISYPWILIVIWCTLIFSSFYLAVFRFESLGGGFVAGLMSLLGVYMIWRKVRKTLDLRKFGVVSLTQRWSTRARPGGQLVALLRIHDKATAAREIEAEIRCQHVTWSKGAKWSTWIEENGETSWGRNVIKNELAVWTSRKGFPLLRRGLGASAEISFDIPDDARPTDFPRDRGDESALMRFRREGEELQHFHRWEIVVVAQVPGIDLERSFAVIIEPN